MILSKCYDHKDVWPLREELNTIVEAHWDGSQHYSRKWEYSMAIAALRSWEALPNTAQLIYDIGGAGSTFSRMVDGLIVDPNVSSAQGYKATLADFVTPRTRLASCVFCISVIEHVDDLDQFLYHLGCLVAPGGLLFLTCDYWNQDGPDKAHWHWMRKRIFNAYSMGSVSGQLFRYDFALLGAANWDWHGPIENWGYAPASLALVKRS